MIDKETGYDDELICDCRPCDKCEGEGTVVDTWRYVDFDSRGNWTRREPIDYRPCPTCKGSAKDTSNCEIEAHWPVDEQIAVAAFRAHEVVAV